MLVLDEELMREDATPAGSRRAPEDCIVVGSGTLGWWCVCVPVR